MSHLTMGDLAAGGALPDLNAQAEAKIARLRQVPGYNEAMLRRWADVIPGHAYQAEIMRLRQLQDLAMLNSPAARDWTALVRSYEDNDATAVRRWETTFDNAGARRSLDWERARARDQARRIFGMRVGGMNGLGQLVSGCFGPDRSLG